MALAYFSQLLPDCKIGGWGGVGWGGGGSSRLALVLSTVYTHPIALH